MKQRITLTLFRLCRAIGRGVLLRPGGWRRAIPLVMVAAGAGAAPEDLPVGDYVLATDPAQTVSLKANQASLEAILEELAAELDIDVENRAGADSLVVAEFSGLPLPKALKRLSESSMIVTDESSGRVARIILLPKGDGSRYVPPPAAAVPVEPESSEEDIPEAQGGSFEFTFDPDAVPVDDPDGEAADDPADDFEDEMQEDLKDE